MKNNIILSFVLIFIFLYTSSCTDKSEYDNLSEISVKEDTKVCTFDFVNDRLLYNTDSISDKAVLEKSNKWDPGQVIRVKFLNGDQFLQNKVKQYANEWINYANLIFEYVPSNQNADIKVAFKWNGDKGSWSYVGNYCKNIPQNEPSMNFGWFDNSTTDEEFSRVIIHEFGHAIGLHHEHQHPTNSIQWNKPVVYAYYAQEGWSQSKVDFNIFQKYSTTVTNYSAYDKYSIMHYSIPASHTTNGYSVGWNTVLSDIDKQFISNQYPYSISLQGQAVPADYDGDGKADIAYKTINGQWFIDYAKNGFGSWDAIYSQYGGNEATPVPADYDGDGKADLSVKTSGGVWFIDYANNGFGKWDVSYSGYGGSSGNYPVPADYDGDGKADLAMKFSNGFWYVDYAKNGFGKWDVYHEGYGGSSGIPVPADYDGDGIVDLAMKFSNGYWYINYANNGIGPWDASYSGYGGSNGNYPVPADYDGDGKADLAMKFSNGFWYVDYANNGFGKWDVYYEGYGGSSGTPVPADYDGDGVVDLAMKFSNGYWYINYANNGIGPWDWGHKY